MKKSVVIILSIFTSCLTFSQKANFEVYALKYASVKNPFPLSYLVLDGPEKEYVEAVFMFWLIKGADKNILVDAGFLKDIDEANNYSLKNYVRPDSILATIGVRRESITDVILTHPHWDHIDAVDLFPKAHVWIQKEDFNYFIGTAWQKDVNHAGFNRRDVVKLININLDGRLTLIDGDDKEILPGINVYTGSRHTFNSQYVVIQSGLDKIVIASDNMYTYYNLEHLKSAPGNATFDAKGYVGAMKRMKTLSSDIKFIIPGHDGLLFSKFPRVAEGVIKIK
jgi:glyoxylase-like metal-dependent hydrolase (beta-lactamase superfamily II)